MQAHRRTGAIAIFAMVAFGVACKVPQRPRTRDLGRVDVAFAGCNEVIADVCALDEQRQMHFWVEGSHVNLQAWTDQGPLPAATSQVHEGQTLDVVLPANARWVAVGTDVAVWREILVQGYVRDEFVDRARADLFANQEHERARVRLEQELPTMETDRRIRTESLLARAAMRSGDYQKARASLVESVAAFKAKRRTSRELKDALALTFLSTTRLSDVSFALALLEKYKPQLQRAPMFKAEHAYQQGLAESFAGNVRGALSAFRLAKVWAERLRDDGVLSATQQWLAMTLMSLGRQDEALALQKDLLTRVASKPACEQGSMLATASWIALAQEPVDVGTTSLWLRQTDHALQACGDPFRARNARLNQVAFDIHKGDFLSAQRQLADLAAKSAGKTTQLVVLQAELQGRVALGQGNPKDAVAVFSAAETLAGTAGFADDELRMLVAKGSAWLQAKKLPAAIKIFRDAEARLDQRLQTIPIGEGRTRFLSARNEGAQGLVSALLASGQTEAAFAASRRARSRSLQSATLGERVRTIDGAQRTRWLMALQKFNEGRQQLEKASAEDWRLSRDELAAAVIQRQGLRDLCQAQLDDAFSVLSNAPATSRSRHVNPPIAAGELVLLYSRRSTHGGSRAAWSWDAFAATTAGVRHVVLPSADPSATHHETHPWLLSFAKEIAAATRIRVLPTNILSEEIHALAFHDRPLIMHAPVVYSLDIEPGAAADGRPLIVADPTGDLPLARLEGRSVGDSLSALAPTRLEGAAAERSRVLKALSHTSWFHYAGHSVFAGVEGLDSGLPLAQGQRLSAADVLGLPASPALVVLSACEAGRSAGDSNMAGLGLAQAFVLAGAQAVVAPTRPVQDMASGQLMQRMYQHLRSGLPAEKALQAAQLDPKLPQQSDWSAFRVLVP